MREVNMRQLRQNLTKELESDCCIMSRGEVVGYFVKQLPANVKQSPNVKQLNVKQSDNVKQCVDADEFLQSYPDKPSSRYSDAPLNLSKEAQAGGKMGH